MTRIWHSGFEMGGGTDFLTESQVNSTGTMTIINTQTAGTWSNYSLNLYRDAAIVEIGGTDTEFFARTHFRTNPVSATGQLILGFFSPSGEQCSLRGAASGFLRTSRNGTTLETAVASPLSNDTWYTIEVHVIIHGSTGQFQVKVNGTLVLDPAATQNTKGQSESYSSRFYMGGFGDVNTSQHDDVALNNASGSPNNHTWIGDGAVIGLVPTADGTIALSRSPGTGANWDHVDEKPPNETDYVFSTVAADRDLYVLADLPVTFDTPHAVMWWMRGKLDVPGAGKIAATLSSGAAGTTVTEDGNQQVLGASAYAWKYKMYDIDPADSVAWTGARVNLMQGGVTVR